MVRASLFVASRIQNTTKLGARKGMLLTPNGEMRSRTFAMTSSSRYSRIRRHSAWVVTLPSSLASQIVPNFLSQWYLANLSQ
jgi:hypothetical protein